MKLANADYKAGQYQLIDYLLLLHRHNVYVQLLIAYVIFSDLMSNILQFFYVKNNFSSQEGVSNRFV